MLPWELLRDPKTDAPLSLNAKEFVRAVHQAARRPHLPEATAEPIRILLVICRPGGIDDVPFRSVAGRLIKALGEAREGFQLSVLRPPTFAQLNKTLRAAKNAGQPYHVVHFDGHGTYENVTDAEQLAALRRSLSPTVLVAPRSGRHGYLVFENPAVEENLQLVDGPSLGNLLAETDVPVLVLNACRSAHAEPPATPESAASEDVHTQVRAFGSLAHEVADTGIAGVVAMRYNVYVVTAAQFVADLYESLAYGLTLGEAVTLGRKQLDAQQLRASAYEPRPLQDWMVPVVFEASPVALFPRVAQPPALNIRIGAETTTPSSRGLADELEKHPDVGFFGRDETFLTIDRAFDAQKIVLLHAYAGSGKTSTTAEFARWYHLTGGVQGPVLFTSFEQYKPVAQVLNESVGRIFGDALEAAGVFWLTLTDRERVRCVLEVLSQIPVLWVWDNVEPIAGFPAGTLSQWSDVEQQALADFLRAATQTKAKFLLTSRRDERTWLGNLPVRIQMPAMLMQERVQLARAIADKHGGRRGSGAARQADHERTARRLRGASPHGPGGLRRRDQRRPRPVPRCIAELRLRSCVHGGRAEATRVAPLLPGLRRCDCVDLDGQPRNRLVPAGGPGTHTTVGSRAARSRGQHGLLNAQGNGHYSIHPALPWFFRSFFEVHYGGSRHLNAMRSFAHGMAHLGAHYMTLYSTTTQDVIVTLMAEEANLVKARRLGLTHDWPIPTIGTMQGLQVLCDRMSRGAEWARLVEEIAPLFVDPATDGPLAGREEGWALVTGYRTRVAMDSRNWPEAERLQRLHVDWERQNAADVLSMPLETLDIIQRDRIRSLAVSLYALAEGQRELERPECVASYEEALTLMLKLEDPASAAKCIASLGDAFLNLPALLDFDKAEGCYRWSLALTDENDDLGRAARYSELGMIAYRRAVEAGETAEFLRHLYDARALYHQGLELTPASAVRDLTIFHGQLGNIYDSGGVLDQAVFHWQEAIRYAELAGDSYRAGQTRNNVALAYARRNRFTDAYDYAAAALRDYERLGGRAAEDLQRTRELISMIERDLQAERGEQH